MSMRRTSWLRLPAIAPGLGLGLGLALGAASASGQTPAPMPTPTQTQRAVPELGDLPKAPAVQGVQDWPTERPPRPLQAKSVQFPPYEMHTLPNGLRVVVVQQHEQPVVSLRLLVRAGAAQDPKEKAGVATLAAALLDQGTATRTASQIADQIDYIGGGLGTGAGTDLSFVNVLVMKDSFDFALTLLSDVVRNPSFTPEELERQREQVLSGLKVSYEDPDYVANAVMDRLIYGFHPYGRPSSGTPESVAAITREDLVKFHDTYFAPNNAILAVVGDLAPDEAMAGVTKIFSDWKQKDVPTPAMIEPPQPTRRVIVVDRPSAVQTEIRVGQIAIPRNHPDYLALNVAINILGGEGGNRLQGVLRSDRGLTYGASADLNTYKRAGGIIADTDTRTETTTEALRVVVDEFARLQKEPVADVELTSAQAYLAGNFPLKIETPDSIAMQVLNAIFYELDVKELQNFPERVNAITPADIQRVSQLYLKPARLSVVLVGDASKFASQLKGVGFDDVELITLPELDLTTVDFRKTGRPAGAGAGVGAAR
jgi:zinc protease